MKVSLSCLLLFGFIFKTYGLQCYDCADSNYDGEAAETCFTTVSGTTPVNTDCGTDTSTKIHYCLSKFTITDGITTGIERGCAQSDTDDDKHSAGMPTADKCTTVLDETNNPTGVTTCYFHCNDANDCNTKTTTSLKQCQNDCGSTATPTAQGSCNYLTGTCVCASGFTGTDCGTVTSTPASTGATRQCVQCNTETDPGCETSSTSVACPGGEAYCSTTTSTIYDQNDAVIHTITTRGCTTAFMAVDECTFSELNSDPPVSDAPVGYKEFVCYSTCDTDGCNINTADGIVNGNEVVGLQCVVCSDLTGDGACDPDKPEGNERQVCPSGTTHCKSTVTYMISEVADLTYAADPRMKLVSVVRECATAAVTAECTETSVGSLSMKKVTCTETCQGDGCNTGWPARPDCVQCSTSTGAAATSYDIDGYDECLENPPMPTVCETPYHAFCTIHEAGLEKGTRKSVEGYPRRISRGCSATDIGTGCSTSSPRDTEIESCNRTCSTDGCNVGSGSTMPIVTFLTFLLTTLFGWLTQRYF